MTAIFLAELLAVSRQAVSQYETNRQSPAPDVMRRITEFLKLPMHHFLRPVKASEEGAVFYRSMATATKSARTRAGRRYEWLREIVAYLRRFVRFPEVRFPEFGGPEDPRGLSNQQIEEFAIKTRRFWRLGDGPISNVLWLLENNGAIVARHELFANKLDAFSEWRAGDSAPFIVLGTDKGSAARSRFDVSHELAHIVLHRGVRRSFINQQAIHKLIEAQAHRFGAAFLLPEQSFAEEFNSAKIDALIGMKAKWKVSIGMMIRRARHLGLITPKHERQLWVNIARRGWRLKEPLDDQIETELPRLLKRSFDLLVTSNIVPRHEMPFDLALAPLDIEELAGLPRGYFDAPLPHTELLIRPEAEPAASNGLSFNENERILRFPNTQ